MQNCNVIFKLHIGLYVTSPNGFSNLLMIEFYFARIILLFHRNRLGSLPNGFILLILFFSFVKSSVFPS